MAADDLVIKCANKEMLSVYELLNSCFGIDADGKVYLRKYEYTQSEGEGDAVTCGNNMLTPQEQFEDLIRKSIVLNSEDKPSLRIGTL